MRCHDIKASHSFGHCSLSGKALTCNEEVGFSTNSDGSNFEKFPNRTRLAEVDTRLPHLRRREVSTNGHPSSAWWNQSKRVLKPRNMGGPCPRCMHRR